ncbi:MAG: hypothetical protein AAGI11_06795 [Pseudomonadota bacterium]
MRTLITLTVGLGLSACAALAIAGTSETPSDTPTLYASRQGDLFTLRADGVRLRDAIEALRDLSDIRIDGDTDQAEPVYVDVMDQRLSDLIPSLTSRYVLIEEGGRLQRVILFPAGGEQTVVNATVSRDLRGRAGGAWREGDIRTAMTFYEMAIAKDPRDPLPRSEYGRLLTLMASYDVALPHLKEAAVLNPEQPQVWLDLYSYYQRTLQLAASFEARARARALADQTSIIQDTSGLWRLENTSIQPVR